MVDLIPLDDARARAPGLAGAKAAGLARAVMARPGLPVLPGWVVPPEALTAALAAGAAALNDRGPAAARLAVAGTPLDPGLVQALQVACAGYRHGAVVRSSSPLEADARWSGAFATYHEVGPDDLVTALLGCAASLFSRDAVDRSTELGVPPSAVPLAVLVQPWLPFDGGGTAVVRPDGTVSVTGLRGDPATLVDGRRPGVQATVEPGGEVRGDRTIDGLGPAAADDVAALARSVHASLGEDAIEWGLADGRLWLLQTRRVSHPSEPAHECGAIRPPSGAGSARVRRATPVEVRLARLAERYPAPLGELLVLPWAVALDTLPEVTALPVDDPRSVLPEIRALATGLRSAVWGSDPEEAAARWTATARALLGDVLGHTHDLDGDGLRAPDLADATRLLGLTAGLADALVARGSLPHRDLLWRLTPSDLERVASRPGARPVVPLGPDRWEPFVAAVIGAEGRAQVGAPVAPGLGAGRVHPLVTGAGRPGPRAVLVTARPVPQIAPLLWGCAALVVAEGSEGAHLFEVARSLGVPAVTGVDLGVVVPGALAAVDGSAGTVAVLDADRTCPRKPEPALGFGGRFVRAGAE